MPTNPATNLPHTSPRPPPPHFNHTLHTQRDPLPPAYQTTAKWTALHLATMCGHAPCAESLLKAGADASLKNNVSNGGKEGNRGRN